MYTHCNIKTNVPRPALNSSLRENAKLFDRSQRQIIMWSVRSHFHSTSPTILASPIYHECSVHLSVFPSIHHSIRLSIHQVFYLKRYLCGNSGQLYITPNRGNCGYKRQTSNIYLYARHIYCCGAIGRVEVASHSSRQRMGVNCCGIGLSQFDKGGGNNSIKKQHKYIFPCSMFIFCCLRNSVIGSTCALCSGVRTLSYRKL